MLAASATGVAAENVVKPSSGGGGTVTKTIAFPGAEGGGMYSKGARAAQSYEVYHVTNLNDSGAGSFRDAVSKSGRFIVFDVSGMIDLNSNVTVKSNTTILGQTAPGDGICFRGNNVKISGENVIVRYLRFRVGAHLADGSDTRAQDGLEVTDNAQNIIIDHCSVSWGTDENLSAYAVKDVTIQNCIIAEALNQSVHEKGEHSYAGIWGGVNLSVHHNLIATHKSRNPKIGTSETVAMTSGYTDDKTVVDIRNNVIYNWGDKAGYGAENGANVNIINNYYKPGPATPSNKDARIFELSAGNKYQSGWSGSVYADGNYIDSNSTNAVLVNGDNWQVAAKTGVYAASDVEIYNKLDEPNSEYINEYPVTTVTAREAYEYVLANAGATLPKQDLVDARIIEDVMNGTAPDGSTGSVGLLDEPTDGIPEADADLYDDRGYPIWSSETRSADYDSDGDGIADAWEDKMGLDKENPTDSMFIGPNGYTYLEIFAEDGVGITTGDITLELDGTIANVSSDKAGVVDIFVDGELYTNVALSAGQIDADATLVSAAYDENGRLSKLVSSNDGNYPEVSGATVKHFAWDGLDTMKPVGGDFGGEVNLSAMELQGVHTVTAARGSSYSNNAYYYSPNPISDLGFIDGDFTEVITFNQIATVAKNSYALYGYNNCTVGAGSVNYQKVFYIDGETTPLGNTKMIKVERAGEKLSVYKGSSLLNWTLVKEYTETNDTTGTWSAVRENDEQYSVNISVMHITEKTNPKVTITNISENQRLGFNDSVEVEVVPDGAAVKQISVSLNGQIVAEQEVDITETQTVSVPLTFTAIAAGTLAVSCVDANLCVATDSVEVTISADLTPWQIADIGVGDDEVKTYVSVTNDYTYKITAPNGYIGSAADKFGFVYQKFTGDNRIYYRSRMQSGSQFGIMLRSSLDADADMFWFGGEYNAIGTEKLTYDLKHREKGQSTVIDYTLNSQAANLYFIAEKSGDTLNIYKTENGSTIYTTKTLLASIDCSVLGDEYYMGFAAVGGGSNPSDAGWVAIDNNSGDNNYVWNFDYGLDWLWQMQESAVLAPSWENGIMVLEPNDEYTSGRYVFHEYIADDTLMPQMSADVYISGDSPALNVYFQTGESSSAYKVTLSEEDGISVNKWYNVAIKTDMSTDGALGYFTITSEDETICENLPISMVTGTEFRTQINTAKKTAVTKAVYFEPVVGAEGKYYIDNVKVKAVEASVKVTKLESWYTFEDMAEGSFSAPYEIAGTTTALGSELSGETATISAGEVKSGSKTIGGIKFTNKLRVKGTTKKFTVPVSNGAVISVYASSASSSSTRPLYINGEQYDLLSPAMCEYTYTGDGETIEIYAGDNIDVYGISVVQTIIE